MHSYRAHDEARCSVPGSLSCSPLRRGARSARGDQHSETCGHWPQGTRQCRAGSEPDSLPRDEPQAAPHDDIHRPSHFPFPLSQSSTRSGSGLRQRSRRPRSPGCPHLSPLAKKASNSAAILQDRAGWLCSAEQLVTTRWGPGGARTRQGAWSSPRTPGAHTGRLRSGRADLPGGPGAAGQWAALGPRCPESCLPRPHPAPHPLPGKQLALPLGGGGSPQAECQRPGFPRGLPSQGMATPPTPSGYPVSPGGLHPGCQ